MIYDLPTSVNVCGVVYEIRYDYRAILDICIALSAGELTQEEKAVAALTIFYPDFDIMPPDHFEEALKQCFWFIDCGEPSPQQKGPRLMDWDKDFQYIVAPVNKAIGKDIRSIKLHWWTFITAYMEIGECTFAHIVGIRDKLARHKKLEKNEREWYNRNREIVDLTTRYSENEQNLLSAWGGA